MVSPKIQNIQYLDNNEITLKILEVKKDIFNLKLKKATRQPIKPHLFKHKKCLIAQLYTLQTQRKSSN